MAQNREPFISRWSRRKRAAAQSAPAPTPPAQAEAPPPELPPIDSLTPESDFSAFMHKKVDEKLRHAALRKLFSDPAFNVVDGLDDYAEDYTQLETLAEGAAAGLEHAKRTLFGGDPDAELPAQADGEAELPLEADADARVPETAERQDESPEADATGDRADDAQPQPRADAVEQKKA